MAVTGRGGRAGRRRRRGGRPAPGWQRVRSAARRTGRAVGAFGGGRRGWARATTRGGSSGTLTTPHRPALNGGTAVAGTIVAPWPSTARAASRRTPSISASACSGTPTDRAARSSTRRSAEPGRQQQPVTGDLGQRQLDGAGERVVELSHQEEVLGEQRLDRQLRLVHGQVHDGGVEAATEQARDQRRRAAFRHDGANAGVAGLERRQQAGEQPAGRRAEHPEAHVTGDLAVEGGHVGRDVLDLTQDPPGAVDDALAVVGETAVPSVDKRRAELALEAGDVAGDVRLHREQRLGCCRERAVVSDGDERRELPEVHVSLARSSASLAMSVRSLLGVARHLCER